MMSSLMPVLAADNPISHVANHPWYISEGGWWIWSAHTGTLVLSGVIMVLLFPWLARKIETGPESQGTDRYLTKNPLAHMVEVICIYLRENTVRPLLGARTDRFMPFLWTIFFFIFINNLLGLLPIIDLLNVMLPAEFAASHRSPIGGTATQNIFVTATLAFIAFVVINVAGIRELGIGGYLKHLTGGAPPAIWPILIPVEVLGIFIKPVALAIRLFANMTAGHVLLATLFMFVAMSLRAGLGIGVPVTIASTIAAMLVYVLELFVALLQAYVFMFLTTVFISQLAHHGHEDHAEHAGHGHAPVPAGGHKGAH